MKKTKMNKWLHGYVVCRTATGSWERFMNMCRHHGIVIWQIGREDDICFCIEQKRFGELVPIARKSGVKPHICKKKGFPFLVQAFQREWPFYSGFLFFLALLFYFSSFVWEITYSGQSNYSRETLSKTVEAMKVYPGMKRSRLDCDAIEKQIRQVHPDISWVSAEEKGSVLQISIKEGKKTIVHDSQAGAAHLVAAQDGIVEQIVANRGTIMVKPGQHVKKGEILIQGLVPVTDDSNEVVENIPVAAKGDVTLLVHEEWKEKIPVKHKVKEYTGHVVSVYEYIFGNKCFLIKNPFKQLDNSMKYDILTSVCADRTIHPLSLSFCMKKTEYREYRWKEIRYSEQMLRQEGMRLYRKRLTNADGEEKDLVEHAAVMKRLNADEWLLQAAISYHSHETDRKAVSEDEITVKKPDGGQDGELRTDS